MKKIEIVTTFLEYDSIAELEQKDQELMNRAVEVRKKAYAPYSKFRVGAAILLEDGTIVVGSNQENAAFPSGLCAERTAIFYVGANYPDQRILKIAISASSDLKVTSTPIPPCGACRQSILEYETKQDSAIEMFFMGAEGKVCYSPSLVNILPFHFDKDSM
ncbi:cytidine deaminase [Myroides odoratimimus]|uniref:Cytidine deaminase n=4 Tax=Myroides TaxID=76831 RepID=A0A0S7EH81_9FLAO|nr:MULTISPECIES: cytidine deaminase [Myroides]AJA67667.1 Cytidine deaminase [Myroides sp. A21]AJH16127.1 cytidine deaminase [Myroides profundi]ALU24962.1 cytidine deaminase [Myroides odoratimimus]APA90986.1 cytidine deaminase [Myroides sp. ZB35]EHO05833.1 cytidine deaminase [Myroides odoratimimus CCUG 10230]